MRRFFVALATVVWAVLVAGGFAWMHRYDSTPGEPSTVLATKGTATGKWRFVVVGTAECPCTNSTLEGVQMAAATYPDDTEVEVRFVGSAGMQDHFYRTAARIKGVRIVQGLRPESPETLGAVTSGQTYLFDPSGKLVFEGGMTVGTGNDRPAHAISLYRRARESKTVVHALVYGCAMRRPGR